ncbi:MAG: hypothetical protein JWN60_64 [Acidobacteria bacterium]|nr:hypothetical protein [Acidobacteriota bacterium]
MKKILFSLIFLILLSGNISARRDEFVMFDQLQSYNCEDFMARLDNFMNALSNDGTSRGFIVVYEGRYSEYVYNKKKEGKLKSFLPRFSESAFRVHLMQNYMINFRRFPKEKVLFISGGFRENHTVELWVVPNGANPPKATPTLESMKYRKGKPVNMCESLG